MDSSTDAATSGHTIRQGRSRGGVRRLSRGYGKRRQHEQSRSLTSTCVTSYGFLEAEKNFRRKQGYRELWVLATALERKVESTANAKGKVA